MPSKQALFQLCMTGGQRREKYPLFKKPIIYTPTAHYYQGGFGYSAYGYETRKEKMDPGNLRRDEYRFYTGRHRPVGSAFSQCRVCLGVFYTEAERKEHNKRTGCYRHLVSAMKDLKTDPRCIICAFQVKTEAFGIPMCPFPTYKCEELWAFDVVQPRVLRVALQKAYLGRLQSDEDIPALSD